MKRYKIIYNQQGGKYLDYFFYRYLSSFIDVTKAINIINSFPNGLDISDDTKLEELNTFLHENNISEFDINLIMGFLVGLKTNGYSMDQISDYTINNDILQFDSNKYFLSDENINSKIEFNLMSSLMYNDSNHFFNFVKYILGLRNKNLSIIHDKLLYIESQLDDLILEEYDLSQEEYFNIKKKYLRLLIILITVQNLDNSSANYNIRLNVATTNYNSFEHKNMFEKKYLIEESYIHSIEKIQYEKNNYKIIANSMNGLTKYSNKGEVLENELILLASIKITKNLRFDKNILKSIRIYSGMNIYNIDKRSKIPNKFKIIAELDLLLLDEHNNIIAIGEIKASIDAVQRAYDQLSILGEILHEKFTNPDSKIYFGIDTDKPIEISINLELLDLLKNPDIRRRPEKNEFFYIILNDSPISYLDKFQSVKNLLLLLIKEKYIKLSEKETLVINKEYLNSISEDEILSKIEEILDKILLDENNTDVISYKHTTDSLFRLYLRNYLGNLVIYDNTQQKFKKMWGLLLNEITNHHTV
jgi:hypothetical protein